MVVVVERNIFFLILKFNKSVARESMFKKYMGSGRDFFSSTIWFQPRIFSLIGLDVMKERKQSFDW